MSKAWPACVDYSYARPSPQSILAEGYEGALRYLGDDGRCLTAGERDGLLRAGVGIGLIWETSAHRPLSGYSAGAADAQAANREADELGAPAQCPIFYAVDFQPTVEELNGPVKAYFQAARDLGGRPVQVYGCAAVVHQFCGVWKWAASAWQCAAWSYPGTAPGTPIVDGGYNLVLSHYAAMLQTIGYVMGDQCDHNNILTAPFWWWAGAESVEGDDMPSIEDLRREFTGQIAQPSHKVLGQWEADSRRYHVLIVHDIRKDHVQWWAMFGTFKLKITDDYVGYWQKRPDVIWLGDWDGGWPIGALDTCIEVTD